MEILLAFLILWSIIGLFVDWYFPAKKIKCARDGVYLLLASGPLVWLIYGSIILFVYAYLHLKM